MVCIAAFIILLIIGVFVAFISIFKPKVGKKYLKTLKKSWSCFGKRVTLQKCETGFGDDIKNDEKDDSNRSGDDAGSLRGGQAFFAVGGHGNHEHCQEA